MAVEDSERTQVVKKEHDMQREDQEQRKVGGKQKMYSWHYTETTLSLVLSGSEQMITQTHHILEAFTV